MTGLDDFPVDQINVIRIPAIADLGVVRQGDHLVIIPGRGVVAVDTRRDPETLWQVPRASGPVEPRQLRKKTKASADSADRAEVARKIAAITLEQVIAVFRERGVMTTRDVGDALRVSREFQAGRDKVKRLVAKARAENIVQMVGPERRNLTQYCLVETGKTQASGVQIEADALPERGHG